MAGEFRRQALKGVQEANTRHDSIKWEEFKEKTLHETWMTEQFNKFKKLNTYQIGGQTAGRGPDILKFIKQWDPQNSSGPVKDAVDIMIAAQEAANSDKLMDFIKPVKQTLGADLFGKLQAAAAASKAGGKMQKAAENKPLKDMLWVLINAAMECAGPEIALEIADLLDETEISKIDIALDSNGIYESAMMPVKFVECVNKLIPTFYAIQELGATS